MYTTASGRLHPVWAFVLSSLLSAAAFYVAVVIAITIAGERSLFLEIIFRPLLAGLLLAIYVWLLTAADHVEDHRLAALGLPRTSGMFRQLVGGFLLGFVLVLLAILPVMLWGGLSFSLRHGVHPVPRIAAALLVLACGALAEELMFRGYPFQHLVEGIGPVGAIVVFSILFGAVHLSNPGASLWGLVNTILIGIVLSVAYLRTRALWLPLGLHFGWNATLGLLLGLPVSGLRLFNVLFRTTATGPRWLTGGSYGIEGSATCVVVVLLGLAVIWKWPVRSLGTVALPESAETIDSSGVAGIQP
jgi:hypothetical protein